MVTEDIVSATVVVVVYSIISIPSSIYSGYILYSKWNEQYLVKRHRSVITDCFCVFTIMQTFLVIWNITELIHPHTLPFRAMIGIEYSIHWACTFPFVARLWLLYFDFNYEAKLAAKPWEIVIAPKTVESNWFLVHKHTLGEGGFILKYIVLPLFLIKTSVSIALICSPLSDQSLIQIEVSTFIALIVIQSVMIGVIWLKYPRIDDPYFIRQELKDIVIFMIIVLAVLLPLLIIVSWSPDILPYFSIHVLHQVIYADFKLMMIVYPKRKFERESQQQETRLTKLWKQKSVDEMRVSVQGHWQRTVSTKKGYENFARYLAHQFALENLLFVTEFVQLKQVAMQNEAICLHIGSQSGLAFELTLPPELTLSSIAEGFKKNIKQVETECVETGIKTTFFESMKQIYLKYIDSDVAPLEINVPAKMRHQISGVFHGDGTEKSVREIMLLMERAVQNIVNLMTEAAIRFSLP